MAIATTLLRAGLDHLLALFGETVTYVPYGGTEREVTALVQRGGSRMVPPTGAYSGNLPTVVFANDATDGISSSELNLGQDNIKVAMRPGQTAESRPIGQLVQVNEVLVELEVR